MKPQIYPIKPLDTHLIATFFSTVFWKALSLQSSFWVFIYFCIPASKLCEIFWESAPSIWYSKFCCIFEFFQLWAKLHVLLFQYKFRRLKSFRKIVWKNWTSFFCFFQYKSYPALAALSGIAEGLICCTVIGPEFKTYYLLWAIVIGFYISLTFICIITTLRKNDFS